ncbi:MAG TPA: NUDIX hydrolase [Polyangiaceae bacterium]|nr:NUDIX hydrolase [Polyangiaceae bacterium]
MTVRVRAAGILVEDGRILLVREGTMPSGEPYFIPPGGGLEPSDHSLHECVIREVWEETGLHVDVGEPIYIKEFFEPVTATHHVEVFFLVTQRAASAADTADAANAVDTADAASAAHTPSAKGQASARAPDRPFAWYRPEELAGLVVFPPDLAGSFWQERADGTLRCRYLGRPRS